MRPARATSFFMFPYYIRLPTSIEFRGQRFADRDQSSREPGSRPAVGLAGLPFLHRLRRCSKLPPEEDPSLAHWGFPWRTASKEPGPFSPLGPNPAPPLSGLEEEDLDFLRPTPGNSTTAPRPSHRHLNYYRCWPKKRELTWEKQWRPTEDAIRFHCSSVLRWAGRSVISRILNESRDEIFYRAFAHHGKVGRQFTLRPKRALPPPEAGFTDQQMIRPPRELTSGPHWLDFFSKTRNDQPLRFHQCGKRRIVPKSFSVFSMAISG